MSQYLDMDDSNKFKNKFLFHEQTEEQNLSSLMKILVDNPKPVKPTLKQIYPKPGICIKFKTADHDVLFVNLCYSDEIPDTLGLEKNDLINALINGSCKLPVSVTDICVIKVKGNQKQMKTDLALNTDLYSMLTSDQLAVNLTCIFIANAVKQKFKIVCMELDYEITTKYNVVGKLSAHYVPNDVADTNKGKRLITEIKTQTFKTPIYELKESYESAYYKLKVFLKGVTRESDIKIDVRPSTITIFTEGEINYSLNMDLAKTVKNKEYEIKFDHREQVVNIVLPIEKTNLYYEDIPQANLEYGCTDEFLLYLVANC